VTDTDGVVLVAFGSNIDAARNLPRAAARLAERVEIRAVSTIYESSPVGAPGTPAFLNAVARIVPRCGPRTLKFGVLRSIELALGRRRSPDRNAPRTIDLDLVLYGAWRESELDLTLPDPDLLCAAHMARPAAEVAPDAVHPADGRTLREIAGGLDAPLEARRDLTLWSATDGSAKGR
jgi:2-amino-4-hydroxy-6-hydroxymethyldihydropteridine diphosphokinase